MQNIYNQKSNMIIFKDLKPMLYLAQKDHMDIKLFVKMITKYNQNRAITFDPIIM